MTSLNQSAVRRAAVAGIVLSLLGAAFAGAQEARYRSFQEVYREMYKQWDEVQLATKIPPHLLHEDIDRFVRTIEELGVNPYINISRQRFQAQVRDLKARVSSPLTRREFQQLLIPLAASLRLSHTYVSLDFGDRQAYEQAGGRYFPFDVAVEGQRLVVRRSRSKSALSVGEQILSINGIQAKALVDSMMPYAFGATAEAKKLEVESKFALWLWWLHGFTGPYAVRTATAAYEVSGEAPAPTGSTGHVLQEHEKYEFTPIDAATGRLTIREFVILDEALFYKFLESTFQDIQKRSIRNLIIDIRGNPGGGDQYAIELATYVYRKPFKAYSAFYHKKSKALEEFTMRFLYPEDRGKASLADAIRLDCFGQGHEKHAYGTKYKGVVKRYLPKPDAVRFQGNVYLLIDGRVYSAANVLAGLVKDYRIGTIIGTETGQSPSNDGQGCWFALPNSNIIAVGATTLSVRPSGDASTTRGVLPDFEVTQSQRDNADSRDSVLNVAQEFIKKRSK